MSVTYVTSGLLDHLPQLGREISGGVIKNNPNQRMTDTTTPKPKDGRKTLSPLTTPSHSPQPHTAGSGRREKDLLLAKGRTVDLFHMSPVCLSPSSG